MKKNFLFTLLLAAGLHGAVAQESRPAQGLIPAGKEIYIPKELRETDLNDPESQYSYHRMACTDDIVVFWEKGFGNDLANAPKLGDIDMRVDLPALMKATQRFYNFYRDTLHFITAGSKADRYRMMVMVRYDEEGTAYGGSYDDVIGALWVTPLRLKDPKFNCIAHELGHSFQAQIGCDGLSSQGGSIWEYTSQWMLWQVNPQWMTDENYHWKAYMEKTHLSPFSFENMYCAPYLMEYWSNKHGLQIVTRIWRERRDDEDPIATYQRLTGVTQAQFNDQVFDAARRYMTYDIERIREVARPYANSHHTPLISLKLIGDWYMLPRSRTLQPYGYHGIELNVPKAGKKVSIRLQAPAGEEGELRCALVPVTAEGTPRYSDALCATVPQGGSDTLSCRVPRGTTHLWLVVMAAPATHDARSQATFPYTVKIEGTTPVEVSE